MSAVVLKHRETVVFGRDLDVVTRSEDASNDLWTVYNRIQEQALGKLVGFNPKTQKPVRLRTVKSIETSHKLNTALFDATINFFNITKE